MSFQVAMVCEVCAKVLGVGVTAESALDQAHALGRVDPEWLPPKDGRGRLSFCSEPCWAAHHAARRTKRNAKWNEPNWDADAAGSQPPVTMTASQLADLAEVSEEEVVEAILAGHVPARKFHDVWVVPRDEAHKWGLRQRRRQ